ncbi:DinB family protein [Streptomyces sp. NPDC053367]|uniref:DinB family protein n=1 Tax=Streptomyces sp. NPDC053367 TaxID=3365700 RepID=UPI0037D4E562
MTDITESEQTRPERTFGWWDMFVRPEDDPRGDGGYRGEHDTLVGYLRDQRLTLQMKCAGLDAEAMARRSVPPSNLSLLGLLRHLAEVERTWFRRVMAGEDAPRLYRTEDDPNADFTGALPDEELLDEAWRAWRAEVAHAEGFVAAAPGLDVTGTLDGEPVELRDVMVHMIEEYARHNGHADFLRERIDGRVGQ